MKQYFSNLNGWQRFFVFVLLFIYLPLTIDRIADIDLSTQQNYSDVEIKLKINEFIKKEKIESIVTIKTFETDFVELAKKYGGKIEFKSDREELEALRSLANENEKIIGNTLEANSSNIKNTDLIRLSITTKNEHFYVATFKYNKSDEMFFEDADVKKLLIFTKNLADQTKIKTESYMEFLKVFLYFSFIAFLTYFFGFMIGWVISGFKRNKE